MLKPKRLSPGDRVAVVSLSSGILGEARFLHKYRLAAERLERDYGLRVEAMPNALRGEDFLYRHPEARAEDLNAAFRDPGIRAVFCAIGGDDTIRLLPYVDFDAIRENPKIFTGFSDTTSNHFMMRKAGLVSYYGLSVMCDLAEYVSINEYTREMMEKIGYPTLLEANTNVLKTVFGASETLYACNTYQFSDYSRYDMTLFTEEEKRAYRDAHFDEDLANARALGKRLTQQTRK